MAPTVEPGIVLIYPWPLFSAYGTDGHPLIGGRLWTYQANTTVPKAAYHDPYFVSPHANPLTLDAYGQATVWLDGYYHLVLEDQDGTLLWNVPSYTFDVSGTVGAGAIVTGSTEQVVQSVQSERVLAVTGLVPLGYRVEGVMTQVTAEFGVSLGLKQILVGDETLEDGWGISPITFGAQTLQRDFRRADRPIAVTAYTVLLAAQGGRFDVAGSITVRATWSSIEGWTL